MLHQANIFLHVFAGLIGIVFGILAYTSAKGGEKHRKYGRNFLWSMAVVVGTALLGTVFFIDRPFLTIVAFQSAYFAFSGWRAVKLKEAGFQVVDLLVAVCVAVLLGLFLWRLQTATIYWNRGIVYYLLFYLCLVLGFDLLRYFIPNLIKNRRFWIYDHIFKLTSAFTALVSAGLGTVLGAYAPWSQIIPAIMATLWLIFCLIYFPRVVGVSS
ncbi:MAG: hypothetical protein AAGA62_01490 [Bacteroidota bacterium]